MVGAPAAAARKASGPPVAARASSARAQRLRAERCRSSRARKAPPRAVVFFDDLVLGSTTRTLAAPGLRAVALTTRRGPPRRHQSTGRRRRPALVRGRRDDRGIVLKLSSRGRTCGGARTRRVSRPALVLRGGAAHGLRPCRPDEGEAPEVARSARRRSPRAQHTFARTSTWRAATSPSGASPAGRAEGHAADVATATRNHAAAGRRRSGRSLLAAAASRWTLGEGVALRRGQGTATRPRRVLGERERVEDVRALAPRQQRGYPTRTARVLLASILQN